MLAAFAGFTLAAALAALYLLEERRLQRRAPDILRLRLPSLVVLERLTVRTIAISLPLLTVGLAAGFVRLREHGGGVDALMAVDDRRPGSSTPASSSPAPTGRTRRAARARRVRARDRRARRARREPLLTLSLVGISHHVAPVELRERVALPLERAALLARALGDAVCLSTCNRTEVYLAGDDEHPRARARSRSSPASRCARSPTGCTTRRRRCTSSASPPGSTR